MALNTGIQTNQLLTNDDEVCIPRLSSILLAVQMFEFCSQNYRTAPPNLDAKTFKTFVSEKNHRTAKRTKTSLRIQF